MKKLLTLVVALLLAGSSYAQEPELYLEFDLMKVEEGQGAAYMETEDFWAGIHKQRALAGEMVGWDLWSLEPSGTDQGYQYMTVNLYGSLEAMMKGTTREALIAHAQKAFPDMSEEEVTAKFNATSGTRDLAVRVLLAEVDTTTGAPEMKVGMVATIAWMKAEDPSYEKAESEIFKPWHQKMVDAGAKSSWGMLRVLLPGGTDRYASHVVYNMFEDISQYVKAQDYQDATEPAFATRLGVQEGLKTRDMKSVKLARLIKVVR